MNFMEKLESEFIENYPLCDTTGEFVFEFIKSKIREAVVEYDRMLDVEVLADAVDGEYEVEDINIQKRIQALAEFGIVEKEE
jgi:hypothetical protein